MWRHTERHADRNNEQSASSELGESISVSHVTGVLVVEVEEIVPFAYHYLHHHGGLPRCVDFPHLYCLPERNEGCLCQAMVDKS